jgi:hypothetical protein
MTIEENDHNATIEVINDKGDTICDNVNGSM